jgi:hypothetical protein
MLSLMKQMVVLISGAQMVVLISGAQMVVLIIGAQMVVLISSAQIPFTSNVNMLHVTILALRFSGGSSVFENFMHPWLYIFWLCVLLMCYDACTCCQLMSSDTQFCALHLVMDYSLLVGLHKEWLVVGITVTSCPHCGVGHAVSTFVIYCHQSKFTVVP